MAVLAQVELTRFTIDVEFLSGGDRFASETYEVEATDWFSAEREALERSVGSAYDNARIPNLTRRALAR